MGNVILKIQGKKCERCGHEWIPIIKNPICCPSCKTPYWDKVKNE